MSTIDQYTNNTHTEEIKTLREELVGVYTEHGEHKAVTVRYVDVPDTREVTGAREPFLEMVEDMDRALTQHPEWEAPYVDKTGKLLLRNEVSEQVFSFPGMHEWREKLVPSALALLPMQQPDRFILPSGGAIDLMSHMYFVDTLDGIGIRSRAKIMSNIVSKYIDTEDESTPRRWTSLASGAALPVFQALKAGRHGAAGSHVDVQLVDIDENALKYAKQLAGEEGVFDVANVTSRPGDLRTFAFANNAPAEPLINELGRGASDVVDALGIFEYFKKDEHAVHLLRRSYELVKEGGVLVIGNMLDSRRQLDFNQRGIGWPGIKPRSIDSIVRIVDRAGISLDDVTVTVPEDGVYAVIEMRKHG